MGAQFPLMKRCDVNGENAHPLFRYLRRVTECYKNPQNGKIKNIPWNFTKFIIDANANLIMYQNPRDSLYSQIDNLEEYLGLRGGPEDKQAALIKLKQTLRSRLASNK